MLGRGVNEVIAREGPAYPLQPITPLTERADLFCVNLECAITPRPLLYSGPPKAFYFRADPPAAETLSNAAVDLVSLANNHALDADYRGLQDTLNILDETGIVYAGAGIDRTAAAQPAIFHVNDTHVAVLAYCDHQADFAALADRPGIHYVNVGQRQALDLMLAEVEALARHVEHVIVSFHWQPNWVPHIHPAYRQLAQQLVRSGARIVWGHSPHHFQGVEWIDDSVVLYSTGGIVDDYALQKQFRNDRQLLFEVTLHGRQAVRVRAYPIALHYGRTYPAEGDIWNWISGRLQQMCAELGSHVVDSGDWLEIRPGAIS